MTPPPIHRVETLDLSVAPWAWPFVQARRDEIAAHFAEKQSEKPKLWNGRILLGRSQIAVLVRSRDRSDLPQRFRIDKVEIDGNVLVCAPQSAFDNKCCAELFVR